MPRRNRSAHARLQDRDDWGRFRRGGDGGEAKVAARKRLAPSRRGDECGGFRVGGNGGETKVRGRKRSPPSGGGGHGDCDCHNCMSKKASPPPLPQGNKSNYDSDSWNATVWMPEETSGGGSSPHLGASDAAVTSTVRRNDVVIQRERTAPSTVRANKVIELMTSSSEDGNAKNVTAPLRKTTSPTSKQKGKEKIKHHQEKRLRRVKVHEMKLAETDKTISALKEHLKVKKAKKKTIEDALRAALKKASK